LRQKPALGPPPTKVGQEPQASVAVKRTVVGCPAVIRRTVKVWVVVLAGSVMSWPLVMALLFSVTVAFAAASSGPN